MTRGYDRLWQGTDRQARQGDLLQHCKSPSSSILVGTKQLSNQILITPKLKQSLKLLFLHAFAYASCPKVKLASVSDERTVLGQVYGGH